MKKLTLQITALMLFTMFISFADAAPASSIGKVVFAIGNVTSVDSKGTPRRLRKNSEVFLGDTISTSAKSQAQLRMMDEAFVSIKPDSVFRLDRYNLDENVKENNTTDISLIKGGFRAITGKIGQANHDGYRINTPIATMGIRGTDYVIQLCNNSACSDHLNPVKRFFSSNKQNLYVGVLKGGVRLLNNGGVLSLDRNQYAMVSDVNLPPIRLKSPPAFLMFDRTVVERIVKRDQKKKKQLLPGKEVKPEGGKKGTSTVDESGRELVSNSTDGNAGSSDITEVRESLSDLLKKGVEDLSDSIDMESVVGAGEYRNITIGDQEIVRLDSGSLLELGRAAINDTNLPIPKLSDQPPPSTQPDPTQVIEPVNRGRPIIAVTTDTLAADIGKYTSSGITTNVVSVDGKALTGFSADYISDANATLGTVEYRLDTAVNSELGYDAATGFMWGRWSDGSVQVNDLQTSRNVTLSPEGIHWIMGAAGSGNLTLPSTGSANYVLIGNTNPTDSLGNVGFLGTATLNADFAAKTLDANIGVSINNQLWQGSQTGIKLTTNPGFSGMLGVSVHDFTTSNNATGTGSISGSFASPNTGGVPGAAAVSYDMNSTINGTATSVSGVAAFEKAP